MDLKTSFSDQGYAVMPGWFDSGQLQELDRELDRYMLRRFLRRGPVRLRLSAGGRTRKVACFNLVAELGPARVRETLVGCAHLDCFYLSPAALDNTSGVVTMTEVAANLLLRMLIDPKPLPARRRSGIQVQAAAVRDRAVESLRWQVLLPA